MATKLQRQRRAKKLKTLYTPPPAPRGYEGETYDTLLGAWLSRYIGWLSPASLGLALYDWLVHISMSPGKQSSLIKDGAEKLLKFDLYLVENYLLKECEPCTEGRPTDKRFKHPLWEELPFKFYSQAFLLFENWVNEATTNLHGISTHHERVVNFICRQVLDVFSPSNNSLTNPEVLLATSQQGGMNFFNGFCNLFEDVYRSINNLLPAGTENFKVGIDVALTKGKVVYRNNLMELIQYEPTTQTVYPEPILIIPAWIMKYYILDLSPHNSLVRYLVNKGHTVFMISWKNPDSSDRDLGLNDYLKSGILEALTAVEAIIPGKQVHTVGYCLGGTLLMIAAAYLSSKGEEPIKTITLFAAQVDFKEAGELLLFVDESQLTYLKDVMWEKGYLEGHQMAGAFSMLHSNEQIWSRIIHDYLIGKRRPINDLIAWDLDLTRLPYRMHSEYLNDLFLNNDLVQGNYKVGNKKIALIDVHSPIFSVATETDHISPWKSVYKVDLFTNTEVTFVLTNGGHNAGIVSEPGHRGRYYRLTTRKAEDKHISSEHWYEAAPKYKGSWWPALDKWLIEHSGEKVDPPTMGNERKGYHIICDAPGTYVFQR